MGSGVQDFNKGSEAGSGDLQQRRNQQPDTRQQQQRTDQSEHRGPRPAGWVQLSANTSGAASRHSLSALALNKPVPRTMASRISELAASVATRVSRTVCSGIG